MSTKKGQKSTFFSHRVRHGLTQTLETRTDMAQRSRNQKFV